MSDSKQRAEYAISVKDVTKVYKLYEKPIDRLKESVSPTHKNYHRDFYALNGLSFNVKKGETVGIIGTNGSGKSTILKIITGVLTPSLEAIGNAVFGRDEMMSAKRDVRDEKSGTKQVRHFYLNMLACISGGRHAPVGYTMTAYHRVLNPQSFRNRNGSWQRTDWIDCMGVTLAMLKSADTKEEYNVALNEKETDRSYLYGRLTAVADIIESRALREADSDRMTNAVRLFTVMQQRPATTWQNLEQKLSPYFGKLSAASRAWYKRMIDSIIELGDDLMGDNSPLSPRFIEGYHNQRYVLLSKKKEN